VEEDVGGDHARALAERGVADAKTLGSWMLEQGLKPDAALCSTATRTRQTLAIVSASFQNLVIPAQADSQRSEERRSQISGEASARVERDSRLRGNDDKKNVPTNIPTILSDKLYLASTTEMLTQIHATDDAVSSLLMVCHNPGAHGLLAQLVGEYADEADADKLLLKFPTSACAVMDFNVSTWRDVGAHSGRLVSLRY
jgi:phosphohistidine phosphatase